MNSYQHEEGQGETVYFDGTPKINIEERIRQIAREEIAAHLERLEFNPKNSRPYYGVQVTD